jgi:hypothetical protein
MTRHVRSIDVDAVDVGRVENGIEELYNDVLDVIVVRNAVPREPLQHLGDLLDRDDRDPGWERPNEKSPVEDIRMLGTPATPTYVAPRGPSLDVSGHAGHARSAEVAERVGMGSRSG